MTIGIRIHHPLLPPGPPLSALGDVLLRVRVGELELVFLKIGKNQSLCIYLGDKPPHKVQELFITTLEQQSSLSARIGVEKSKSISLLVKADRD